MNILHLMSQTHLTGPEVYVASLCARQEADGNKCIIVSDTLTVKTEAEYVSMAIHDRRYLNRLSNIIKIIRLCRARQVDIIHAHSRAASWLANIVQRFIKISYISTIHGRQSVHASSKRGNVYGDHIIVICEHLQQHVRDELNIQSAELHLVRNGID